MRNLFLLGPVLGFMVFAANSFAAPPSVFLVGDGGQACALLNQFPVSYNFLNDDYSLTSTVAPVAFQKGNNELTVHFSAKTKARYIVNLRDFPHVEDLTYVVELGEKPQDGGRSVGVEIGIGEAKKTFSFTIPPDQHGTFQTEKGEAVFKKLPEQFTEFDTTLSISFENPNSELEQVPWKEAPPATPQALEPIRKTVKSYVEAMNSGDLEQIAESLSLRWQLEEKAGGVTVAKRREGIAKFLASGQALKMKGEVKTFVTFPQSPVALIAEQQISMLRAGREVFPQLYLMPSKEGWKIIQ